MINGITSKHSRRSLVIVICAIISTIIRTTKQHIYNIILILHLCRYLALHFNKPELLHHPMLTYKQYMILNLSNSHFCEKKTASETSTHNLWEGQSRAIVGCRPIISTNLESWLRAVIWTEPCGSQRLPAVNY